MINESETGAAAVRNWPVRAWVLQLFSEVRLQRAFWNFRNFVFEKHVKT